MYLLYKTSYHMYTLKLIENFCISKFEKYLIDLEFIQNVPKKLYLDPFSVS
jgi:hypothetical protein